MKRLFFLLVAVAALISFNHSDSEAGTKIIKPTQLRPCLSDSEYYQSSEYIYSSGSTAVAFAAEVKLPVGATIKKFIYYHQGSNFNYTAAYLYRAKMNTSKQTLAGGGFTDGTLNIVPIKYDYINYNKVQKGYTYWVYVISENSNSKIKGIKIIYK